MKNGEKETKIPVIDLFAGPGGLGEGFSCFPRGKQKKRFKIHLSVEKDANAHKTLTLRAFYRQFPEGKAPDEYYEYVRGKGYFKEEITWEDLKKRFPKQTAAAEDEARRLKLGEPESDGKVHDLIKVKTESVPYWVLVGGPPCQAYSLAGRSRRLGFVKKDRETEEEFQERKQKGIKEFEEDEKQKLYEEYRRIIADHWPSVFVMENVKGMGSARDKIDGNRLFPKMIEELSDPGFATKGKTGKHTYNVYSFLTGIGDRNGNDLSAGEYEIHSESFAVPQKRHRIILLGIRDDLNIGSCKSLKTKRRAVLEDVIRDLPPLDSSITRAPESTARTVISDFESSEWFKELLRSEGQEDVIDEIRRMARLVRGKKAKGGRFLRWEKKPEELRWEEWFHDPKLEGVLNHESRRHMASDLERYFFASCFTRARGKSPTLVDFPEALLPNHKNIVKGRVSEAPHQDRFRVQRSGVPAMTITCHIGKDGHANIHPNSRQVRCLTVREAARLQTFPDNYFFEGDRTVQFQQVGNAVPPYLAHQLAEVVWNVLQRAMKSEEDGKRNVGLSIEKSAEAGAMP